MKLKPIKRHWRYLFILVFVAGNVWIWYPFAHNIWCAIREVKMSETLIAAFVGGFFGVAGASIAAYVAYRITKKQIKADVFSAATGLYINNLRESISEYQSVLMTLERRRKVGIMDLSNEPALDRFNLLWGRLHLLLNPELKEDKELESVLEQAAESLKMGGKDFVKFQDAITEVSRRLLQREWKTIQEITK